jgi:hypothetical protein
LETTLTLLHERLDDLEIISQYNAEIRGFYNYYSIANNSSFVQSFSYILEYSMYKTYALKYQTSISQEKTKKMYQRSIFHSLQKQERRYNVQTLLQRGFQTPKKLPVVLTWIVYLSRLPLQEEETAYNKVANQKCELCGANEKLEMHHIRKLKDLKGKQDWENE